MIAEPQHAVAPEGDDALRLPRVPGTVRRFWSAHPLVTDVLLAALTFVVSLLSAVNFGGGQILATDTGSSLVANPTDVGAIVAALMFAASAALVVRRRIPELAFALGMASELAFLLAPVPSGTPILLVSAYSVAVYRSSRKCWLVVGGGVAVIAVVAGAAALFGRVPLEVATNIVASAGTLSLIGALVGVNIRNRRRYVDAILDRSHQLVIERDRQGQLAAVAERTRIAREMHDIVAHSLTVVVALAEGAAATHDAARARTAMDAVSSTARGALTEMRAMLGMLRDDTAGDAPIAPTGTDSAQDAVEVARRAGFPVALTMTGAPNSPAPVALAVSRIVQESVTNAMRHAPNASFIRVSIDHRPSEVQVDIVNDGVVRGATPGGFGLVGLRERAVHLGGTIHVGPDGPGRWAVRVVLPSGTASVPPPSGRM